MAITSRSLTLSVIRRAEPASSTRSAAGCARSAATSCSPTASARFEHDAGVARRSSAPRWRVERGAGGSPRPWGRSPSASGSAAPRRPSRSASSESIASSSNSRRARLGPRPGRRVISSSPAGNLARSLTAAGIAPSSASASTFSWIVAPIPGSSVARPCARQRGDRHRRVADRLGGVAVGDDPVDDRAVELVQVAQLVERGGDLGVGRVGHLEA